MDNQWNWAGARWWKFDFHTHTPASNDYGNGANQEELKKRTPKEWLLDYMNAGIDCVAITDHNSGVWIDKLKTALKKLQEENHEDIRPLYLFPGVEISVSGGFHILALLPMNISTSDIDSLLGAAGFPNDKKGTSDAVTTKSPQEVINEIIKMGGLAIPAHADKDKGIFKVFKGQALMQILDVESIIAMEIYDQNNKPQSYLVKKLKWAEVLGSDSHHPDNNGQKYPGSHFTWIKMGKPDIKGLRLALLDGDLAVKRSNVYKDNPNEEHSNYLIEKFEIKNAKYIGQENTFIYELNPWLNTIIGGRGTGKSTILEFLRLTLRREKEIPKSLEKEFKKYKSISENRDDEELLLNESNLIITYRKDNSRYKIQWDYNGNLSPIEAEKFNKTWEKSQGDITQRFPVRIYSQKQIFELAKKPQALLDIIDKATNIEYTNWEDKRNSLYSKYLSLQAQIRDIKIGFDNIPKIQGELEDINKQLAVFEKKGHTEVLKIFQIGQKQVRAIENWENSWKYVPQQIKDLADAIKPNDIDTSSFSNDKTEDLECINKIKGISSKINEMASRLIKIAEEVNKTMKNWQTEKKNSQWSKLVKNKIIEYIKLKEELKNTGVKDISEYGQKVQRKQLLEEQLKSFGSRKKSLEKLGEQAQDCLKEIIKHRKELTKKRSQFLTELLAENTYVSINIIPYGDIESVENQFRKLINREYGGLEKDIGSLLTTGGLSGNHARGLLGNLYNNYSTGTKSSNSNINDFEKRLYDLKNKIKNNYNGKSNDFSGWFIKHIKGLSPESLDRLDCWFPEDSLNVLYSLKQSGEKKPIQHGSPGQKTAALLAFLLSYGNEPLILDQPEDDLDNHLIYDLIVTQVKAIKPKRQIIIVTHNANIVVNGDSENVMILDVVKGQTLAVDKGCLQKGTVRKHICHILEGGEQAFDFRYKRIREGEFHV